VSVGYTARGGSCRVIDRAPRYSHSRDAIQDWPAPIIVGKTPRKAMALDGVG